jgi:hypothetical protein
MERPALQQLLADITAGRVDIVCMDSPLEESGFEPGVAPSFSQLAGQAERRSRSARRESRSLLEGDRRFESGFLQRRVSNEPRTDFKPGASTSSSMTRSESVKGYEYGRAQFVTLTPEELKALDVESSKVIDLEKFAPRGDLDPVYFDSSYYLYPDGPIAVEALRVIGAGSG